MKDDSFHYGQGLLDLRQYWMMSPPSFQGVAEFPPMTGDYRRAICRYPPGTVAVALRDHLTGGYQIKNISGVNRPKYDMVYVKYQNCWLSGGNQFRGSVNIFLAHVRDFPTTFIFPHIYNSTVQERHQNILMSKLLSRRNMG